MSVAEDVARHFQVRAMTIPTPHVPHHGVDDKPEEGVLHAYDIFFPLDGTGPHYPHARSWSQIKMGKTIEPKFFFFADLVLMAETGTEGAVRPIATPESDINRYRKTVYLTALKLTQRASPAQSTELKKQIIQDRFVDLRFKYDVDVEMKRLEEKARAAGKGKGKGKGKSDEAEEADAAEDEEEDDEEETNNPNRDSEDTRSPAPVIEQPSFDWVDEFDLDFDSIPPYGDADCLEPLEKPPIECVGDMMTKRSHIMAKLPAVAAAVAPPPQKKHKAAAAATAAEPYPADAPILVPKIDFTVTSLPLAGKTTKEHHDVAGVMVRFLVRDPTINPGCFFANLLSNLDRRLKRLASASANGGRGPLLETELFPNYSSLFHTIHPAGNHISKETYFRSAIAINPDLSPEGGELQSKLLNSMAYSDFKHPFHMANLLTTKRAVADMIAAGVDPLFTSVSDWWEPNAYGAGQGGVAKYPRKAAAPTYKYNPCQVFYHSPKYIGLSEQFFPHIDLDQDFLSSLMSGANIDRFIREEQIHASDAAEKVNNSFQAVRRMIRDCFLIDRKTLQENKLIKYDTPNEFVHRAAETAIMDNRIAQEFPAHYSKTLDEVHELMRVHEDKWRGAVSPDLDARMQQCERYNLIRNKAQEACLKTFCSLWLIEGDIDRLNIPPSIKVMQRWYRDSKFPNLTREYLMWDPSLGLFGNSMLRHLKIYSCIAKIVQPIVCLLAEGLFSCYHWGPRELAFNLLAHGKYDVGKTFAAITTLIRFTTIDGTVEEYSAATAAADTTSNHNYDLIIASDEVMQWKVNAKAAEANQHLVNREKVKLTSRQTALKAFVSERGPNGENVRWCRNITTDHYVTLVEVTNCVVEATNALSSRYHRFTMAQPRIPARELKGYMSAALKSDSNKYLQINQYLSACAYKAAMCGVLLQTPDMQLFHDVSNRVLDFLVEKKAIERDIGSRGLEIMEPYARQLVVHMSIHCAFDMPGGACYKKRFDPSMIRELQPYMYCTTEIVWWCWTSMASGWVDEQNGNVIRAACIAACDGSKAIADLWRSGYSAYGVYEHDKGNVVKWRTRPNPEHTGTETRDSKLVDLQYVEVHGGNLEAICRNISSYTNPHLDWTDVQGILNVLQTTRTSPKNGGLQPQPLGTFAKWHKYQTLPNIEEHIDGVKATGATMPSYYTAKNADTNVARTEDDVPILGEDVMLPVVDMSPIGDKFIYIMPSVADAYTNDVIVTALIYATMSSSMRPGKMLLGLPDNHDTMQLQVYACPADLIEEAVDAFDEDAGFVNGKWIGSQYIPEDERPISRRVGIAFNRRGGIATVDQPFFTEVPLAPVEEGDNSWKERSLMDMERMKEVRYVCKDLDYESAKRQHMACGRPLDAPVFSPAFIEARYRHECGLIGRTDMLTMDYPHDLMPELDMRHAIWNAGAATKQASSISDRIFKKSKTEYNKPKNPAVAARMEARKQLPGYKKRARERDNMHQVALLAPPPTSGGGGGGGEGRNKGRGGTKAAKHKKTATARQSTIAAPPPPPSAAAAAKKNSRNQTAHVLASVRQ